MVLQRVTQNMISGRSLANLQLGLGRLARTQEQLATGRVINRPSDSPVGTTAAMRVRSSLAAQAQFQRNAEDGAARLRTIDAAISTATKVVNRAKELALQGANAATGPSGRAALATEVVELREAMLSAANTTYLGRPVFGGITSGASAYDTSGSYVGSTGSPVLRTVAEGVRVQVDVEGPAAFGGAGSEVFADLAQLAADLTAGDQAGISAGLTRLDAALERLTSAQAGAGTRADRIDRAIQAAKDATLSGTQSLSEIEDVDLAQATMELKMQEVAYQAALGATSRVIQPSLSDFLR